MCPCLGLFRGSGGFVRTFFSSYREGALYSRRLQEDGIARRQRSKWYIIESTPPSFSLVRPLPCTCSLPLSISLQLFPKLAKIEDHPTKVCPLRLAQ